LIPKHASVRLIIVRDAPTSAWRTRQVQHSRNPTNLMILRDDLLEIEAIEQLPAAPSSLDLAKSRANATESHSAAAAKRLLQQNRPKPDESTARNPRHGVGKHWKCADRHNGGMTPDFIRP
jgi:hypothetical protein